MNLRPLWVERRGADAVGAGLAILLGLILSFSLVFGLKMSWRRILDRAPREGILPTTAPALASFHVVAVSLAGLTFSVDGPSDSGGCSTVRLFFSLHFHHPSWIPWLRERRWRGR